MRFKKTPLFGQDSSPRNTSDVLAFCGSAFLWLIFLICAIFIKPKSKNPEFKEIQIILTPAFSDEKSNKKNQEKLKSQNQNEQEVLPQSERQSARENPTKTVENLNSAQSSQEILNEKPKSEIAAQNREAEKKSAQNENAKNMTQSNQNRKSEQNRENFPQKTENILPAAEKSGQIEYAKSVEELMAEQMAAKNQKKEADWGEMFADDAQIFKNESPDDFSQENKTKTVRRQTTENAQSSFFGAAGVAAQTGSAAKKSESAQNQNNRKKLETSSETLAFLQRISNASFAGDYSDGIRGQTDVQIESGDDNRIKLKMSNGNSRSLLEPSEPKIFLSQNAAKTIDASRAVKIRFKVVESGNVPINEIQITPASSLSEIVRDEIIAQISKWRFEAENYAAFAEFDYKIIAR